MRGYGGFLLGLAAGVVGMMVARPHPPVQVVAEQASVQAAEEEATRVPVGPCGVDGFVDHVMSHLHEVPTKYLVTVGTACDRLSLGQREVIARELQRRKK